jgi:hypothetical protein
MTTSIELRAQSEELNNKAFLRLKEAEGLKDATRASEIETEVNRMLADADALDARADLYAKAEERASKLNEADARRPNGDRTVATNDKADEARAAFVSYLKGDISERELRAMNVATDAKGGYTAPSSTQSAVQVALGEQGPMVNSAFVSVLSTDNGNSILYNTLDDRARVGTIIGEGVEASETDLTLAQRALGAFKYTSGKVLISNELLQDSNTDVVALVVNALTAGIDRGLNRHFTNGTGSGQPRGVLTALNADASALVTTAGAAFSADELFKLQHKVAPAYRNGGQFMLSDEALFQARTMKDLEGRYIWRAGLDSGVGNTILGSAYQINPDMGVAAGTIAVTYGQHKNYTFRQVRDFSIKRSDELAMTSDQVVFVGFMRADGDLTNVNGLAGLKIKV